MTTEPKNPEEIVSSAIKTARLSFWISFCIGTLLLLLYLFKITDCTLLLIIGFSYVQCAALANAIVFISLLLTINQYKVYNQKLYLKGVLILANIPIAYVYYLVVIKNMY